MHIGSARPSLRSARRSAEPGSAGHHAITCAKLTTAGELGRRHREVLSSIARRCRTKLTGVTQFLSGRIVNPPTSVSVAMMTMAAPGLVLLSLFFGFLGLFVGAAFFILPAAVGLVIAVALIAGEALRVGWIRQLQDHGVVVQARIDWCGSLA